MKNASRLAKITEKGLSDLRNYLCGTILEGNLKGVGEKDFYIAYQNYLDLRESKERHLGEYDEDTLRETLIPFLKRNYDEKDEVFKKTGLDFMDHVINNKLVENIIEPIIAGQNAVLAEFAAYSKYCKLANQKTSPKVLQDALKEYEDSKRASEEAFSNIINKEERNYVRENRVKVICSIQPNMEALREHICLLLNEDGSMVYKGGYKEFYNVYQDYLTIRETHEDGLGEYDEEELRNRLMPLLKRNYENRNDLFQKTGPDFMNSVIQERLVEEFIEPIIEAQDAALEEHRLYEAYQQSRRRTEAALEKIGNRQDMIIITKPMEQSTNIRSPTHIVNGIKSPGKESTWTDRVNHNSTDKQQIG